MPEGYFGIRRLTSLGPFTDSSCDDVIELDRPIEVMTHYHSSPRPLYIAENPSELKKYAIYASDNLDSEEMVAIHSTSLESARDILDEGFDEPEGSGLGSDVRRESIFFWIHHTDTGVFGGYPYVVCTISIKESVVSDWDMFNELEQGYFTDDEEEGMTGHEYDEAVIPLEKYLMCLERGKHPDSEHTIQTMFDYRMEGA